MLVEGEETVYRGLGTGGVEAGEKVEQRYLLHVM